MRQSGPGPGGYGIDNLSGGLRGYLAEVLRKLNAIEFGDPNELIHSQYGIECPPAPLSEVWQPPCVQALASGAPRADESPQPGIDLPMEKVLLGGSEKAHLLLAGAGSGKSTVCRYIACKLAAVILESEIITAETPIPIYVSLRKMISKEESTEQTVAAAALDSLGYVPNAADAKNALANRMTSAYLLLDGLDELAGRGDDASSTDDITMHIKYLLRSYPRARFLLTCRDHDYRADNRLHLPDIRHLSLSLFTPEQVQAAVRRWHKAAMDLGRQSDCDLSDWEQRAERLIQTLALDRDVAELARVPLLLNIMQVVFGQDERLPRSVGRLCERAVRFLTIERPRDRIAASVARGEPLETAVLLDGAMDLYVLPVLEALAFELHSRSEVSQKAFTNIQDLERIVSTVLRTESLEGYRRRGYLIHPTMSHLLDGNGVLAEVERDCFGFTHNVFRDVLAGNYLGSQPSDAVIEHVSDTRWHAPLRYWAGLHSGSRDGMAAVLGMAEELLEKYAEDDFDISYAVMGAEMLGEALADPPKNAPTAQASRLRRAFGPTLIDGLSTQRLTLALRVRIGDVIGRLGDSRLISGQPGLDDIVKWTVDLPAARRRIGRDTPHRVLASKYTEATCWPSRDMTIGAFRLCRYPVTNQDFQQFINAGGYSKDSYWQTEEARNWRDQNEVFVQALEAIIKETALKHFNTEISAGRMTEGNLTDISDRILRRRVPLYWHDPRFNRPNQPVVGINWWEARAYCNWLESLLQAALEHSDKSIKVDLPTEFEWERAARDGDDRPYPWGSGDPGNFGLFSQVAGGIGRSIAVGSFPWATWPGGPLDLAGNVWEWTLSHPSPYDASHDDVRDVVGGIEDRIVRGSSWLSREQESSQATFRSFDPPCNVYEDLGFRVAIYMRGDHE
jgi:formylglycine-generating enzyme required for sulfatase activity